MARRNSDTETLTGLVERVLFHNEDTGYCILKVLPDGSREQTSLVGSAPRVVAGEQFEAEGRWEPTRDFGPQFRASLLKLRRPASLHGIEKYLGSGLIDGIGPAYAKRLVDRFGDQVFSVIENESARLEEVEGIGRKRRLEIRESWVKQKAIHNIMLFLHQHGISSGRALRIHKTYGDEALAVLRRDPFRLAQDIHGIGFKTADQIAAQLGTAADAPERIRAGVLHVLESGAVAGDCCLPERLVVEQGQALLNAATDLVEREVGLLLETRQLERHHVEGQPMLFLPYLRAAEQRIAQHLLRLTSRPASYPPIKENAALEWAKVKTGRELAPSQVDAVRQALRQRCLVITGGPGVGKTTILRTVVSILANKKLELVLAAPTGRAAKRLTESTGMEAKTLHRLLEFQGGGWGRHGGRRLQGDLFVIDEASMIDAPLMAQFLSSVPEEGHLLLVGDADQLPSVGPGRVLQDIIASGAAPVVKLTEIFRQATASRIITSAHDINQGKVPDLRPTRDGDFFFLEATSPEEVLDTLAQLARTRLPARYGLDPVKDIQVLTPMNRHLLGTRSLNEALQSALNPPSESKLEIPRFGITFRTGDKVIQTQNNYDKEVFNGDIGRILEITLDPVTVKVKFDEQRVIEYEPGDLDELHLAYALTIHKSQGSEFPCVLIPLSTQHYVLLERSLIYTAVTRAKKLVILVGDQRALALAVSRQDSRKRWTSLRQLLCDSGK